MQAKLQKSTLAQVGKVEQSWFCVDAKGQVLGRLAVKIAMILMGKNKPSYTAHVDTGDFVIVTNASQVRTTGKKALTKEYESYTYHPGGHKHVSFADMMKRKPELVIKDAVRRMLPKSKMGDKMLSKLKVYRSNEHPHSSQSPKELTIN